LLIEVIVGCLEASENTVLQNCLKVLKSILDWPLKMVSKNRKNIVTASLSIIQKLNIASDLELIQDAFKVVRIVLETFGP
jgi:hypothetical protein